jgi:hypothetical protein
MYSNDGSRIDFMGAFLSIIVDRLTSVSERHEASADGRRYASISLHVRAISSETELHTPIPERASAMVA